MGSGLLRIRRAKGHGWAYGRVGLGVPARQQEKWNAKLLALADSSRTIEFHRFNLSAVAVHAESDRAATDFTILNG